MSNREATSSAEFSPKPGQRVYDKTGREIGVIIRVTESGVAVTTGSENETLSLRHTPNENHGEGYLLWRCIECGELGNIEKIPDHCPSCGTGKEDLYAYLED